MSKIIKRSEVKKNIELKDRTVDVSDILPAEGGGILNKKVLDASKRAQVIIEEAKQEAERIRQDARDVLSEVSLEMEKAKSDGFNAGLEEGMAQITEKSALLQKLREDFYEDAEPQITKLVMMIAEKVIGKIVREHESAIKSIVHLAVESSIGERIVVRLNPLDHRIIISDEMTFKDILDRTKRIAFKEDETITKGGCIVETEVGTIDARLETQLKAIRKALEL